MNKTAQEKFYKQLGERIKAARIASALKQEALASYLELSRASVINIEKGRQHPPLHLLSDIARTLKVDIASLFPDIQEHDSSKKSNWEKLINKKIKNSKQAGNKILGFVTELNSAK